MIDIAKLIAKLRAAPQRSATHGRGDTKPLDEYRVVLTAEERDWLDAKLFGIKIERLEIERLKRTSGEG